MSELEWIVLGGVAMTAIALVGSVTLFFDPRTLERLLLPLVGGLAVASAFLTDIHLGVTTWLVAAAHEVPQELGDFGVLVHGGEAARKRSIHAVGRLTHRTQRNQTGSRREGLLHQRRTPHAS